MRIDPAFPKYILNTTAQTQDIMLLLYVCSPSQAATEPCVYV